MPDPDLSALQREVDQQTRLLQGLQMSVFTQPDPAGNSDLLAQLAAADAKLGAARAALTAARAKAEAATRRSDSAAETDVGFSGGALRGRMQGEHSTGLAVKCTLRMDPLPTGAYHLMDPETEPLLTVEVTNVSREIRRICVKAHLEGLSAQAVRTQEIAPKKKAAFHLQPTLFPERTRDITEIQRATLHVVVEDLDGKIESHNTYPITCLARTASFNAVRRPDTGEMLDLSHYYGAWVTPHANTVQERIRRAVELAPERRLMGYQGDPELVTDQVAALYAALREAEIVYVNSVIDYGAAVGMTTQRTRLPRESISLRSANCIDGTVLLASLMEGVSLNPAIVLVPGHAFVGWEVWDGADEWRFLETTMIGSADFETACKSGQRQHEQFTKYNRDKIKLHSLQDLRARGVWPME